MFKNVLTLAFRRLFKKGAHPIVSLLSLSIGIASIILMFFYVKYEYSYDKFNTNHENVFRVERTSFNSSQDVIWDSAPFALVDELKREVPEVSKASAATSTSNYFMVNNIPLQEYGGLYVENAFIDLLDIKLIQGNKASALKEPKDILVSKSLAVKLFGSENILGKSVLLDNKNNYQVTGVFEDYPENSHLDINYLLPFGAYEEVNGEDFRQNWEDNNVSIYVMLNENVEGNQVSNKIRNRLMKHLDLKNGEQELLSLRPLYDIYLNSTQVRNDKMYVKRSDISMIYLFLGVAIFTIIITVINYINSISAQLLDREKEIGVKKVLSISKSELRLQFIIESCLSVSLAFVLGLLISYAAVPVFNMVIERNLSISFFDELPFISGMFGVALLLAILAGLYPAFFLSSLKISSFLQGASSIKRKRRTRKVLVVLQLIVAIPLIFCSLMLVEQIAFLENKDIGFQKEELLVAGFRANNERDKEKVKRLKNQMLQDPNILNVSISDSGPFGGGFEQDISYDEREPEKQMQLRSHSVDYDFLKTYKMTLLEGRVFSKEKTVDLENACIINETALKQFGWDSGLDKKLNDGKLKVIGTVKDFNDVTLFYRTPPMILTLYNYLNDWMYITIKVTPNAKAETQRKVNEMFNNNFAETPIAFQFLQDKFKEDRFFTTLRSLSKVFIFFSFLAIFQAMIGLFNLVSFSLKIQKRMIAIRKVMGAENLTLFKFLAKEYLMLFGIALAISLTASYFLIRQIFEIFVYKVEIEPIKVVGVVLAILSVLMLTIAGKIYAASRRNPIEDLKAN